MSACGKHMSNITEAERDRSAFLWGAYCNQKDDNVRRNFHLEQRKHDGHCCDCEGCGTTWIEKMLCPVS